MASTAATAPGDIDDEVAAGVAGGLWSIFRRSRSDRPARCPVTRRSYMLRPSTGGSGSCASERWRGPPRGGKKVFGNQLN